MAEHIITLADHEARRLKETGTLLVVRPFPEANEIDSDGSVLTADGVFPAHVSGYMPWIGPTSMCFPDGMAEFTKRRYEHGIPNPLGAPGDTLVCKETWALLAEVDAQLKDDGCTPSMLDVDDVEGEWFYRATDSDMTHVVNHVRWRPASTMPAWAVRFRPVVREAGVMRIDDVTYGQCIDMGLDMSAVEYEPGWDTTPLVRYWTRRFPKYPWESNCWVWWVRVEREDDHA